MASWVYILRCADGSYYTGCTTDLDSRIAQHRARTFGGYTSTRLPIEVAWCAEFQDLHDAIDFERKVKRWSRAKKESFIEGDWERLRALASRSRSEAVRGSRRTRAERSSP
ncbi:MAG TPA: GIY-YIG nuclease family protein [Caulobacteraceae bacterium]|nr:GIY-YIG nuclease family protein [Caulobacteraceae bacterium]